MNPSSRMVFLFFAVEFRFGLMETIRVIERCVQDVKRCLRIRAFLRCRR